MTLIQARGSQWVRAFLVMSGRGTFHQVSWGGMNTVPTRGLHSVLYNGHTSLCPGTGRRDPGSSLRRGCRDEKVTRGHRCHCGSSWEEAEETRVGQGPGETTWFRLWIFKKERLEDEHLQMGGRAGLDPNRTLPQVARHVSVEPSIT